ncbi:hypothetical protein ACIQPR_44940 [Streptomyces sp. NPDC091280]|uniref:hypothetical protein n=1 Tax=Streptomyces sp. NPDC091280 TaxID=3365984 RepID=UPI0037FBB80D
MGGDKAPRLRLVAVEPASGGPRLCRGCGVALIPVSKATAVFCSSACRSRSWRRTRRTRARTGAVTAGVRAKCPQCGSEWTVGVDRLAGCRRNRRIKAHLADRLTVLRLERRQCDEGDLPPEASEQLAQLLAQRRLRRTVTRDRRRTAVQRALIQERLARYPIDDDQMAPTRLGNAIRRFEEYGWDRYRLDTQLLWNELTGCVPDQVRRQVDLARTSVDFFVALLFGHVAAGILAALTLTTARPDTPLLLSTIAVLFGLVPLWYRSAVAATDEWAAAVRALVNSGRKPLADCLGLALPATLAAERDMWAMVSRLVPYHERAAALDPYRMTPSGDYR